MKGTELFTRQRTQTFLSILFAKRGEKLQVHILIKATDVFNHVTFKLVLVNKLEKMEN